MYWEHSTFLRITSPSLSLSYILTTEVGSMTHNSHWTPTNINMYTYIFQSATASRTLRSATVNIVPQSACLRAYLSIATVTSEMICAVGANPGKDACQGDSGGPLAYNGYLIGLVSWGEGCADVRYPGVYTRVSVYTKWIQEVLDKIDKNTVWGKFRIKSTVIFWNSTYM